MGKRVDLFEWLLDGLKKRGFQGKTISTDAIDYEVGQALQAYGIQLMMQDIDYDGKPNKGVGMTASVSTPATTCW